tara:strand:+ start:1143 stop:1763 length:621 start_codon:yes stop_codon:yes gene_type:complete
MEKLFTNQDSSSNPVTDFEKNLAKFTGAKYAIATDCCTHAIELCLRLLKPKKIKSSCYTYLSIPMTFKKLSINVLWTDEVWLGEYNLGGTRIWDSARLLHSKMYRKGQLQCLSFGNGKPLDNKRGGAILCDSKKDYEALKRMSYDGRDLSYKNWPDQKTFEIGYHYNMPYEHAEQCNKLLEVYKTKDDQLPRMVKYPDCRTITIKG